MSKLTLVLIVCVLCVIGVSLRAVAASVDAALLQQTPTLTITATPMSLCPTATPVQGASVFSSTPGAREPATASPQTNCVAPTATPYWIAQPTSAPADTAYTADTTLEALGVGDITLADPVGSSQFRFTIPEDWVMRGTNQLTLNLQYFQDKPDASGSQAGNLLIALDNTPLLLANVQANTAEAQQLTITLPNDALNDPERRTHSLRISLDTLENCRNNITARLFMDTALSGFRFEYQQYPPLLDLAKYPRPFYNNDLVAIPEVLMVMPDKAAATDWEAAASLAGGLGRMTGDNITTRVVNAGELTTPELRDHNMILIGKPADNALTAALFDAQILPVRLDHSNRLTLNGTSIPAESGVLQLIAHPENPMRAILVVTGQTDIAVSKAAQALSGVSLRLGLSGAAAVVSDVVQESIAPTNSVSNTTFSFADLGYENDALRTSGTGTNYLDVQFTLPAGYKTTDSAFLELHYGYSDILQSSTTVVTVTLNDVPLSSTYLSQNTAANPQPQTGWRVLRAAIPPSSILPGQQNNLSVRVDIEGQWNCSPPANDALWFSVDNSSFISLPLSPEPPAPNLIVVGQFPVPFNQVADLHNVWMSLPEKPTQVEFQQFIDFSRQLGATTDPGALFMPRVSLGALPANINTADYHFIVWGRPSNNPIFAALNSSLPQPFAEGSDEIQQVIGNVVFQLPPGFNLGILEVLPSPWNHERAVLVITGTSVEAQIEAGALLLDDNVQGNQMIGDVVFTRGGALVAVDTRLEQLRQDAAMTALPQLSTQQAEAVASTPVALAGSATPQPTATFDPSLSPTPLYTIVPTFSGPTPLATFVPLSAEAMQPIQVERPEWVNGLVVITGVVTALTIIYGLVRLLRRRR